VPEKVFATSGRQRKNDENIKKVVHRQKRREREGDGNGEAKGFSAKMDTKVNVYTGPTERRRGMRCLKKCFSINFPSFEPFRCN
jgi:hypothetical protein